MCGICGVVSVTPAERVDSLVIERMRDTMMHRGPNDCGCYVGPGVGLGHRRLSIIDLRREGRQPMANEDGSYWIVFNGEIYDFAEHRRWLVERGHVFRSLTDTEVVLHLYEEIGAECLERLRGMFAFAIWDERRRTLFMARDRAGKKPLFYCWDGRRLIFGSEPKAILAFPGIFAEPHFEAINLYVALGYVPSPLSAFKGIRKLPPAHFLEFRNGRIEVKRYWQLSYLPKHRISAREAQEEVVRQLTEAVKLRMVSDVPLGVLLSGGIDSSAVVALMSRLAPGRVKTFSIGFKEKEYDETVYARLVARKFGTEHHEFQVEPNALEVIDRLVWHYNEPYGDVSALPTYYLCKLAREKVTVALNGDGGDENFAGYVRHSVSLLASYVGWMPRIARHSMGRALAVAFRILGPEGRLKRHSSVLPETFRLEPSEVYPALLSQFNREYRRALFSPDFAAHVRLFEGEELVARLQYQSDADNTVDRMLAADVALYLPDDLLVKFDVAAMAVSLETRSPMLDHKFMEFAARLPARWKMNSITRKVILKKAFAGVLPDEILHRRKMGFGVPIDHWFRGALSEFLHDTLLSRRSVDRGYFDRKYIERLVEEHTNGRKQWQYLLWNLLMLELWHRVFIDSAVQAAPLAAKAI
jgi:asparagine synthase (glutamine-hydrolysing)